MGSTRKSKKQYSKPLKMWDKDRLDEERPLIKEFGLKNKKELWKTTSLLRKYARQAKILIASRDAQGEVEKKQLLSKLARIGVLSPNSSLDDVLSLTAKDFLNRRLQTIVYKRKLSKSISQSRQFITHRHIKVENRMITAPSHLVDLKSEPSVAFVETSNLKSIHLEEQEEKRVKQGPTSSNTTPKPDGKGSEKPAKQVEQKDKKVPESKKDGGKKENEKSDAKQAEKKTKEGSETK